MLSYGDNQVVLQSLTEVRFINVIDNKVHGLFTYDLGDIFQQRDIFVIKQAAGTWHTYMAYPRYSYEAEKLYVVVDRVTVDS